VDVLHIDLADSARARRQSDSAWGPIEVAAGVSPAETVLGVGPLGKVEIPGSNRLILAGWAPAWRGFSVSTLGSAGASLRIMGIDAVVLRGRAATPSALVLAPGREPRLVPIDLAAAWKPGTHALLRHVAERCGLASPRVLGIGPGARTTTFGAIASASVDPHGELVLETWAGRGGFGTKLLGTHGLAAIVLDAPRDAGYLVRPPAGAVPDAASLASSLQKYRYHPKLETGGTLGANLSGLRERMLAFNHASVEWSRDVREEIHARLVRGHYLAQHQKDTGGGKKGKDCGETCPAQCRREVSGQKKDFQPFAALGPSIGIFDQRAAESVYAVVEEFGVDAVDAGALAAWWMERIACGAVSPADAGAPRAPVWEPAGFDPVADSHVNATVAAAILRRALATTCHLADVTAVDLDRAVLVCNDEGGALAPTQYWAPGVLAPTPIVGKYYTDYSLDFVPPRELGRRCGERTVAELALDNLGICRFQREWAEDSLDELLLAAGTDPGSGVDARHRALAQRLAAGAPPALWRGARVRALVAGWAREAAIDDPRDPELARWAADFARDPRGATRAFHRELALGVADAWIGEARVAAPAPG